jgi:hypothetical protein
MYSIKESFLKKNLASMLKKLKPNQKGKWGKMTPQQIVEHFADAVKNATGKLRLPLLNRRERLQKSREFLMSETPFKENTLNPLVPEEGIKIRKPHLETAIDKVQKELNYFLELFGKHPSPKR